MSKVRKPSREMSSPACGRFQMDSIHVELECVFARRWAKRVESRLTRVTTPREDPTRVLQATDDRCFDSATNSRGHRRECVGPFGKCI